MEGHMYGTQLRGTHDAVAYLAKVFDPVRAKGDQARASRTGLYALHPIIGGGVAPQQVHEHYPPILHGQGPLQVVYLLNLVDGPPNSCRIHKCSRLENGFVSTQDVNLARQLTTAAGCLC